MVRVPLTIACLLTASWVGVLDNLMTGLLWFLASVQGFVVCAATNSVWTC